MTTALSVQPYAYAGEADLTAIADLMNTCRVADELDHRTTVTRLREDFADPTFTLEKDLQLWRDESGTLLAVSTFWPALPERELACSFYFDVHPQERESAWVDDILSWAEARLLAVGQDCDVPLVLHSSCRDTLEERRSLLFRWGFEPVRYFHQLQRSLTLPLPKASFPVRWPVRSVTTDDAEEWVEMFNQTFVDHWNHQPMTVAEYRYYVARSDYDPNLDIVVESLEGEMAAFCYCHINPERNARLGIQEGHVCLLGTRRGYRRMGLARALLVEGLRRLQLAGMTTATIGVDAENPLGAPTLYRSVGFESHLSSTVFSKRIKG